MHLNSPSFSILHTLPKIQFIIIEFDRSSIAIYITMNHYLSINDASIKNVIIFIKHKHCEMHIVISHV